MVSLLTVEPFMSVWMEEDSIQRGLVVVTVYWKVGISVPSVGINPESAPVKLETIDSKTYRCPSWHTAQGRWIASKCGSWFRTGR